MGIIVRYPGAGRRFTRRQVLLGVGKASAVTVVAGTFGDLLTACGGSTKTPTPAAAATTASTASTATSVSSGGSSTAAPTSASPSAAVAPTAPANVVKGGTFNYGTLGDLGYGSLDMSETTGTYDLEIGRSLNDAYIWLDPNGTFVPGLAESWQVSGDALTYTFKLRQGLTFHDGTPLDANAVKYNFDRMTDRTTNPTGLSFSYLGAGGAGYGGCDVVDSQSFRITLTKPNAIFLFRMRRKYVSPQSPDAVKKDGSKDYSLHPVAAGPFKFVEWVQGDHVTMAANPDYKSGPAALFPNTGRPYVDQIVYRIYADPSTKATALESGDIDYASGLLAQDIVRFQSDNNLKVVIRDQTGQAANIDLNTEKPPTDDPAVRQAIGWAIDRDSLVKSIYFGLYKPATHIFTTNMFSYDASLNSLYGYDQAKAAQVLDAAGWKLNGATRYKNGQELTLIWILSQTQQAVAQFVQAELKKIGMNVQLQTLAGSGLNDATLKGQQNMYGPSTWIQEDPDVVRNWASSTLIGVRQNYIRVKDPNLDNLLNQGLAFVGDPHSPARAKIYQQIQQIIMQNYYTIPVYYQKSLEAHRLYVHADNIGYDPYGVYHEWTNVWMDKH